MTGLFRDRCPCRGTGTLPGGARCLDFPRCRIEELVAGRLGRDRAISIAEIAAATRLSPREIKQHVHDLRMDGVRIGSTRQGADAGYFMIENLDELREFLRGYGRQAITELRLIQRMLGKDYALVKELEGQLALDLGTGAGASISGPSM